MSPRNRLYWWIGDQWVELPRVPNAAPVSQPIAHVAPVDPELHLMNLTHLAVNQVLYGGPGPLPQKGESR